MWFPPCLAVAGCWPCQLSARAGSVSPLAAGGRGGSSVPAGGSSCTSGGREARNRAGRAERGSVADDEDNAWGGAPGGGSPGLEPFHPSVPWAAHRFAGGSACGGAAEARDEPEPGGVCPEGVRGRSVREGVPLGLARVCCERFGGVGGQGLGRTGGAGRRGAATGTRGGAAGLDGWRGWRGGGRARGRAGGAELSSRRRPEGAGVTEARHEPEERSHRRELGLAPPRAEARRRGADGGGEARAGDGSGPTGAPEHAPRSPPRRPLPPMPVARARKAPVPAWKRPQLWNPLPSPPLVAKGYTAYGGRCRWGGAEGGPGAVAPERGTSGGATAEGGGARRA